MPYRVGWHSATYFPTLNQLVLFGGFSPPDDPNSNGKYDSQYLQILDLGKFSTSLCSNDSDNSTWRVYNNSETFPESREGHAATALNDTLLIYGGLCSDCDENYGVYRDKYLNDVSYSNVAIMLKIWKLDLLTLTWTQINISAQYRVYFSMHFYGSSIFVFGGGYQDLTGEFHFLNDVQALDSSKCTQFITFPVSFNWSTPVIVGQPPGVRWSYAFVPVIFPDGEALFVIGGSTNIITYSDIWVLELACQEGYFNANDSGKCIPCSPGFYSNIPGSPSCKSFNDLIPHS